MKSHLSLKFTSCILFLICLALGFLQAQQKPLWNDEIYTLIASVNNLSYWEILIGRVGEGNACPLFYLIQKAICDLANYSVPAQWIDGQWNFQDPASEILLRINPVILMSLAITLIFYFFSRFYSWKVGLLSLFLSLTSFMIWRYWAEARPYALWVFLTTLQSLLFLMLMQKQEMNKRLWPVLVGVHFLMALTIVFSLSQIVIVSVLLWFLLERNWKKYMSLTLIPSLICLYYYFQSPHYEFWFSLSPEQLVRECVSRDRFYIIFIFSFFVGLFFIQKEIPRLKLFTDEAILKGTPYLLFFLLNFAATVLVLFIFKLGDTGGPAGFPVSSRYFIYLTPLGIIAVTLFTYSMIKAFKRVWWLQVPTIGGIGYLLIHRLFKLFPYIKSFYPDYFF